MSLDVRNYGEGTSATVSMPFSFYLRARVMCSDGKVRATKRLAQTADTFFSVPASVSVSGKTVSGYATIETRGGWSTETPGDPWVLKFRAYQYGRNAGQLPEGVWKAGERISQ
jgi:hypothetical protein